MEIGRAINPLLHKARSGRADLSPLNSGAIRTGSPIMRRGERRPKRISAEYCVQYAYIPCVQRRCSSALVGIRREAVRRDVYLRPRQYGRRYRICNSPNREKISARKQGVDKVLNLWSAERMTRLDGEAEGVIRVFHLHEIEVRRGAPRVRAGFGNHANLGVLESPAELKHVRRDIQCLIVHAQGGEVRPVARGGGAIERSVKAVISPRAERIGGGRY